MTFKKGMLAITKKDIDIFTNRIIPEGTELIVYNINNRKGTVLCFYDMDNEKNIPYNKLVSRGLWKIPKDDITPKEVSPKKQFDNVLKVEHFKRLEQLVNIQNDVRNIERVIEMMEELKPGYYLFKMEDFTADHTILYHLTGFSSRGFKGKVMARDIQYIQLADQINEEAIKTAVRIDRDDLPTLINLPYKTPEFDKALKGE